MIETRRVLVILLYDEIAYLVNVRRATHEIERVVKSAETLSAILHITGAQSQ